MKPSTFTRLAVVAVGIVVATGAFIACSSDNSNPAPPVFDSGLQDNDANAPPGTDANVPPGTDANGPTPDGNPGPQPEASLLDTNLPDVGNCVSDASTCNSCYTPAQDPLNGCSPATANCVPFDNTRVPSGAP